MVVFEDIKLEKEVIKGVSCIAVPMDVFKASDGEVIITTYRFCEMFAREFEELYYDDPFSDEALAWIDDVFSKVMKKYGYKHFESENSLMKEYVYTADRETPIFENTENLMLIDDNDVLKELCKNSGCDIEIDGGEDVIFAVVENSKILSYAGINDLSYDDGSAEISVETADDSRRQGFGSLCVSALTSRLVSEGKSVYYKCASDNIASAVLAEKCSFELLGERYSHVFENLR